MRERKDGLLDDEAMMMGLQLGAGGPCGVSAWHGQEERP